MVPKIPCPDFATLAAPWVWGHVCYLRESSSLLILGDSRKSTGLGLETWYPLGREISNRAQLEEEEH